MLRATLVVLCLGGFSNCGDRRVPLSEAFPGQSWAYTIENLKPLRGSPGNKAADCATCHEAHYREWQFSTHAWALADLQFQAELTKNTSPRWLCLNCHIPLSNQRETLVSAVWNGDFMRPVENPNPEFDPQLQKEAITCGVCHLRSDGDGNTVVIGPGTGGWAPHPVKIDQEFLNSRCESCHNVTYTLKDDLLCSFQTGDELRHGPYAGQKNCISCHMTAVQRPVAKGGQSKTTHRHSWPGGGVPKSFQLYREVLSGGYRPGLEVTPGRIYISKGGDGLYEVTLTVVLKNAHAGHKIPTGDPERHYIIEAYVPVQEFLNKKATERIGQTWQWHPKAQRLGDNRLAPLEIRELVLKFPSPLKNPPIRLSVYHVRLTEENAVYMRMAAERVPQQIQEQVASIEKHYPFRSEIFRAYYHPRHGWTFTPLKQLMQENSRGSYSKYDIIKQNS